MMEFAEELHASVLLMEQFTELEHLTQSSQLEDMEEHIRLVPQPTLAQEMEEPWSPELNFLFLISNLFSSIPQVSMEQVVSWLKDVEEKEVSSVTLWDKDSWQGMLPQLSTSHQEMWSVDQWQCRFSQEEELVPRKITSIFISTISIQLSFTPDFQVSPKQQRFSQMLMWQKNQFQSSQQFTTIWEVFQQTTKLKSPRWAMEQKLSFQDWWQQVKQPLLQFTEPTD